MSKRGRLEAQLTFASNQSISVAITGIVGSPFTVTVDAGSYYPTDLLSTLQTELDGASGSDGAWTVSGSFGESGTGLVTISHATETFTITWTSTDIRGALGFTGTLTPAALTFTGTNNAWGVWLPDCPHAAAYGPSDPGHIEYDRTETMSPRGDVQSLVYQSRTVLPYIRWSHISRAKARVAAETTTYASFEYWWRLTHGGETGVFRVGPPVRLYWDADVASYHTYRLTGRRSTEMPKPVEEWAGLFSVELNNLIRVPGT